jgi:hypothetical protein
MYGLWYTIALFIVLLPARYVPQFDLTLNGGQKAGADKEVWIPRVVLKIHPCLLLFAGTGSQKVVGSNPISSTNKKGVILFFYTLTLNLSLEGRGISNPKSQAMKRNSKY